MALVVLASSLGFVALPDEASAAFAKKRGASASISVPRQVAADARGQVVTVRWRVPVRTASSAVDRYEVRYRQQGQRTWSASMSTTTRTARIRDLVGGRRAQIEVRARDEGGAGPWSEPATAMPLSEPAAVRSLHTSTSDGAVRLIWAASRSGGRPIQQYEVMYRQTGAGRWRHVHREVERATITDLKNSVMYSFRVRAKNSIGYGPWTTVVRARAGEAAAQPEGPSRRSAAPAAPSAAEAATATPAHDPDAGSEVARTPELAESVDAAPIVSTSPSPSPSTDAPAPPAAPGDVEIGQIVPGRGSVTLSWSPGTGVAATSYEVRTRLSGTSGWSPAIAVATESVSVGRLTDGLPYDFSVRAVGAVAGEWSAALRATAGAPTAPSAPSVRFADESLAATVEWSGAAVDPNGSALSGWDVRYRTSGDTGWAELEVTDPALNILVTDSLPKGFTYLFSVRARSEVGEGAWSGNASMYVPVLTLPVLSVDTADAAAVTSTETYLSGSYSLDPNGAFDAAGSPYSAVAGVMEIKGRGNSTWTAPKKPYRLKLAADTPLLGMPASKHWVLLANYYDHSLLRNETALYLGTRTGLAWTPRTRYVEVLLNGDYLGLYQLAEQVRIGEQRINIKSMKAKDVSGSALTGGYQLERDGRWGASSADAGFMSSMQQPIVIKDPEVPTAEQSAYIQDYFGAFEQSLQSTYRADPAIGYANYIDVDSFVDWYIVEEYTQNVDANFASVDLYKPRDGKLTMGPLWDFDLAMENAGQLYAKRRTWWVKDGPWWQEFFKDPAWEARVEARWRVIRKSLPNVMTHIDSTQQAIATAAIGDSNRWGGYGDHDMQIDVVRGFLTDRAAWLDQEWASG